MDHLKTYKELLEEISSLIGKLETSSLTMEELFELENATRKLHERSIILRYKAFENKLVDQKKTEEKPAAVVEKKEPEPVKEKVAEEEQAEEEAIDFSMFNEPEESEEIEIKEEEPIEFTEPEPEPEPEEEEEIVVEEEATPIKNEKQEDSAASSFIDKFMTEDNSLSSKFSGSKLDSLVGAFGLNEKLRYINDLFDGSSDQFSNAIKILDAKNSMDEATGYISELASEHEWDYEEEVVAEFMVYVKRRYA